MRRGHEGPWTYAIALYRDPAATLDNLRESVTTLEESEQTARRVLGGAHPATVAIEKHLQEARACSFASLRVASREAVEAMTPGDA